MIPFACTAHVDDDTNNESYPSQLIYAIMMVITTTTAATNYANSEDGKSNDKHNCYIKELKFYIKHIKCVPLPRSSSISQLPVFPEAVAIAK